MTNLLDYNSLNYYLPQQYQTTANVFCSSQNHNTEETQSLIAYNIK